MKLDKDLILPIILAALKEDVGPRDLTSVGLIPKSSMAEAELVVRQEGIVAGLEVAEWTFGAAEPKIRFKPMIRDGQGVYPGKAIAFLEGPARGILAAERTALNFLGRLSGIATLTHAFVERALGTGCKILDTRKTTPTLRLLEKYAVAMGGGINHRMGLYDQVLIKENHLRLISGGIREAVAKVRSSVQSKITVELEVTSLQEFRQALGVQPDIILLDNMKLSEIQEVVRLRDALARSKKGRRIPLEVSGGVNLSNVRPIAQTGVDRVSVGALTHSAPSLDVALEIQ